MQVCHAAESGARRARTHIHTYIHTYIHPHTHTAAHSTAQHRTHAGGLGTQAGLLPQFARVSEAQSSSSSCARPPAAARNSKEALRRALRPCNRGPLLCRPAGAGARSLSRNAGQRRRQAGTREPFLQAGSRLPGVLFGLGAISALASRAAQAKACARVKILGFGSLPAVQGRRVRW